MSLFGNLKTEGLEESTDRLGGYAPLDTDIYSGKIKMAYAGKSDGGAYNISLLIGLGDKEYRETIYITNKKGENFFLNPQDKTKKVPLPGFTTIDEICLVASGKPLAEQEAEEKVVNLYDYEAKKELPKSVQMLTALIGQDISLGIVRVLENKQAKDSAGVYQPTADEREVNVIEKVFDTDTHMTVPEARSGQSEAKFWDLWQEKNKGNTRDKRTFKEGQAGTAGKPRPAASATAPAAGGATTERKSLFGKK